MVLFFDLSVPYLERDDAAASEKKARRDARLKAVVKAMELGYAAVAYDRPFRGVMSDADRCKIPPFPLSSLLGAAPALASTVAFHRDILGVPLSASFRQYSRLTVSISAKSAAAALHPGNPVLRTYDIAAVRPLNQVAFDEACKFSEVDIISIDFSQRLPFRLKLPMVDAAIKRGLFFEITYSHLIADVHVRRQMLSDAKLLVDWTRGKNLIISSAASTVNEIRGPYDVANLSAFLLGLSIERAKATISKNCRSLVANALRKKHCYKEAIRIERILPDEQLDSERVWLNDCNDWDPISSSQGDLPSLDDMTKFFSSAGKLSKSSNTIDFTSIADGMPFAFGQHQTQVSSPKKLGSSATADDTPLAATGDVTQQGMSNELLVENWMPMDTTPLEQQKAVVPFSFCQHQTQISSPKKLGSSAAADGTPLSATGDVTQQEMSNELLIENRMPMDTTPLEQQKSVTNVLASSFHMETSFANAEEPDPDVVANEDLKSRHAMISDAADVPICSAVSEDCKFTDEENLLPSNANPICSTAFEVCELSDRCLEDHTSLDQSDHVPVAIQTPTDVSEEMCCINVATQISSGDNESFFAIFMEKDMPEEKRTEKNVEQELKDENLNAYGLYLQSDIAKHRESDEREDLSSLADDIPLEDALMDRKELGVGEVVLTESDEVLKEFASNKNKQIENNSAAPNGGTSCKIKSVKRGSRQRPVYPAFPLPFKGLFKPMLFKKKMCQFRRPRKHLVW
ncbi:protein GAMETOPHYTE DEFECTIVE 1 [Phoenix dactylifera]|uniref:Protein GAMETOPHYTE DEFECTIVE 1 n=1 Tax=Phoenix dactylifera TaxID=42345 RepID=A0A8B7BRB0_PHODC|nr:protein GAMETOPHYTE DEFECTIVE 1 [Phoenix dactylifera]